VKFAKGDLIRVKPDRRLGYGREPGFYLVLESGLPRPLWAPPARPGSSLANEEWIKFLRLETGQVREDLASAYEKVTKGQGKSP